MFIILPPGGILAVPPRETSVPGKIEKIIYPSVANIVPPSGVCDCVNVSVRRRVAPGFGFGEPESAGAGEDEGGVAGRSGFISACGVPAGPAAGRDEPDRAVSGDGEGVAVGVAVGEGSGEGEGSSDCDGSGDGDSSGEGEGSGEGDGSGEGTGDGCGAGGCFNSLNSSNV